jgi:signal transduction histidine kinase
MARLRGVSISTKLMLCLAAAATIAALLAGGICAAAELSAVRASMVGRLSGLTGVIGANSAAALALNDSAAVEKTLASLAKEPLVAEARIYDENGKLLATYPAAPGDTDRPSPPPGVGHQFVGGKLQAFGPIESDGRRIGTVLLTAHMDEIRARVTRTLQTTVAALLGSLAASLLLGVWLQRAISEPILKLAETAESISSQGDYSVRVQRKSGDELGLLYEGFNSMLEQIQVRDEALARSNRELQDFAYVASHDLQEPLRKIVTFSDRVKATSGDGLSEQCRDYLERMQSAAGRMQTLILDLLEYSRVTTRAQPFTEVSLKDLLKDVLSLFDVRLDEVHGRVDVGDLPTIDADPMQIRQLFQNLIGNALKYHKRGVPPAVSVSSRIVRRAGRVGALRIGDEICELTFTDNGIGFDMQYAERIFNVFQRLHARSEYEGTGVGLAICRKIAERHGGSITARSSAGEGATFVVMLPLRQSREGTSWREPTGT